MTADLARARSTRPWLAAGFVLRRGTGTIERPRPPRPRTRGCSPSGPVDPLLVERRVIDDGHGRRIEATESRYPADRYGLDVQFDVEGPDPVPAGRRRRDPGPTDDRSDRRRRQRSAGPRRSGRSRHDHHRGRADRRGRPRATRPRAGRPVSSPRVRRRPRPRLGRPRRDGRSGRPRRHGPRACCGAA